MKVQMNISNPAPTPIVEEEFIMVYATDRSSVR
jgi:hypothetical protein